MIQFNRLALASQEPSFVWTTMKMTAMKRRKKPPSKTTNPITASSCSKQPSRPPSRTAPSNDYHASLPGRIPSAAVADRERIPLVRTSSDWSEILSYPSIPYQQTRPTPDHGYGIYPVEPFPSLILNPCKYWFEFP